MKNASQQLDLSKKKLRGCWLYVLCAYCVLRPPPSSLYSWGLWLIVVHHIYVPIHESNTLCNSHILQNLSHRIKRKLRKRRTSWRKLLSTLAFVPLVIQVHKVDGNSVLVQVCIASYIYCDVSRESWAYSYVAKPMKNKFYPYEAESISL